MTRTLTVEGEGSDDDVVIPLTTAGSKTAPSRDVPSGMTKIVRIIAGVSADLVAAGSAVVFLRLGGTGVRGGEQTVVLGAIGGQIPDDDSSGMESHLSLDVDIDVQQADQIDLELDFAGDDLGEHGGVVTIIFA